MTFKNKADVEMYAVTGLTTAITTVEGLRDAPVSELMQHLPRLLELEDLLAETRQRIDRHYSLAVSARLAGQGA